MVRRQRAGADAQIAEPIGEGDLRGSQKMGTAVISGATFTNKSVVYYDVNGIAIVEGDIALGPTAQVEATMAASRDAVAADPQIAYGVGISGSQFRWPNCRIPYEIDPNLPNQQRVTDAIAHWEANTTFRFPLRTAANAAQYPNYVRFTDAGGCWSLVGMQGGQQTISLGPGCGVGNAIHEIGHTVGLWHEQSREDRDLFVTIHWENIQAGMAAQFNQHIADGDDLGTYDYGSIMHYPRTAFSANGQDTITPTDPNAQIGQRNGLSAGDLAAVRAMYPGCRIVQKLPWREPVKKIFDDRGIVKKLRDDPKPFRDPKPIRDPKGVLDPKGPRDPKGPLDPRPKPGFDPIPPVRPGGPVAGGLLPFALATPHHAMLGGGAGAAGDPTAAYGAELAHQLLEIEAAIADAQAASAHAAAEIARLQALANETAAIYDQALDATGLGG
ncbi:MAG TPA: Dot/Icm T4SS effector Zinc-dependent metalloprotease LegP [Gemmatimonadaceae bacterium]